MIHKYVIASMISLFTKTENGFDEPKSAQGALSFQKPYVTRMLIAYYKH